MTLTRTLKNQKILNILAQNHTFTLLDWQNYSIWKPPICPIFHKNYTKICNFFTKFGLHYVLPTGKSFKIPLVPNLSPNNPI